MKAYRIVNVQPHVFLTSALVGGEWSASRLGRFTPEERAPGTHWTGGLVSPRAGLVDTGKWKFLPPPGLKLRPLGRSARSQLLYRLHYPKNFFVKLWYNSETCVICMVHTTEQYYNKVQERTCYTTRYNSSACVYFMWKDQFYWSGLSYWRVSSQQWNIIEMPMCGTQFLKKMPIINHVPCARQTTSVQTTYKRHVLFIARRPSGKS
jgi:hypothetical protein